MKRIIDLAPACMDHAVQRGNSVECRLKMEDQGGRPLFAKALEKDWRLLVQPGNTVGVFVKNCDELDVDDSIVYYDF
jgi:hypothetical protein